MRDLKIGMGVALVFATIILMSDGLIPWSPNVQYEAHGFTQTIEDAYPKSFWVAPAPPAKVELPKHRPPVPDQTFRYYKTIYSKVTAYTPGGESCGIYTDGKTSIGKNAWNIVGVATAPKALPYGSWVYIPGVGYREVDDTGSAMRKSWDENRVFHIDLRFGDLEQAKQWGVKQLNVHVFVPSK